MPLRVFDISNGKPVQVDAAPVNPPAPTSISQSQTGGAPQAPQAPQAPTAQPQYTSILDQLKAGFGTGAEQKAVKNKPGLDLGDLAGLVGQAPVIGGSIAGGIAGSGVPVAGTVAGAAAGAGLGELVRTGIGKLLGVQKDATAGGVAKSTLKETAIGATSELGGKALTGVAKGLKAISPTFFSFTTGLPPEVFEKAIANPNAVRGAMHTADIQPIVDSALSGISNAKKVATEKYGQVFAQVAKDNVKPLSLNAAKKVAQEEAASAGIKFGKVNNKYVMSFNSSKIANKTDQAVIKEIFTDLRTWQDRSVKGVDTLASRISNRISESDLSPSAKRIVSKVADGVKNVLPEQLQNLREVYHNHLDALGALESVFGAPGDNKVLAASRAETKLRQIFKDNKTVMRRLFNNFEATSGTDIQNNIAGLLLSKASPQVLRALSFAGGSGGAAASLLGASLFGTGGAAALGLASTSPRLVGETLTGIAKAHGAIKPVLNKAAPILKGATMEALRRLSQ